MRTAVPRTSPDAAADDYAPRVFAHRGSSVKHAEHTLEAYLHAIDEGADGLECDVRLTRDRKLVCVHDSKVDRTSDGKGRVSLYTLEELNRLNFSAKHLDSADGRVLTLEHLLSVAVDAGRPIELLIETKHPSRYGAEVEDGVIALLRRFGLEHPKPDDPVRATVMSFSPTAVRRIRHSLPDVPTVMLIEFPTLTGRTGWLPFGSTIGGPGVRVLRSFPDLANRLHRRGHRVFAWTVNTLEDLQLVLALQADGIITDKPGFVLEELVRLGLRG
jgi:glycerophosphoryl diester phosphodiesterase